MLRSNIRHGFNERVYYRLISLEDKEITIEARNDFGGCSRNADGTITEVLAEVLCNRSWKQKKKNVNKTKERS